LAHVSTYGITERFHDLRTRLDRKEWLEELNVCQEFHDAKIGRARPTPDFLGYAVQCGYLEYLQYVFKDPSGYTPAYKSYLLVCCATPRMMVCSSFGVKRFQDPKYWTRQELTSWLQIVNYLLSQGCKSELAIDPKSTTPYRVTGLEAFLWTLSALLSRISWDIDPVACGLVLETLRYFSESGADFTQTIYGYYRRNGLYNRLCPYEDMHVIFGQSSRGEQNDFRLFRQVVVEWSIFGALARAIKTQHRGDYFCSRLEEFLTTIGMDTNSLNPKILAVCHPYNRHERPRSRWMKSAKRISGKHEERLMENISQWISQTDADSATKVEKLDGELDQIISDILADADVPEGVFDYFRELGFLESWPRFLAESLYEMGFTARLDKYRNLRLPNGVIYPPVK
jgi:hypothetical protein